MVKTPKLNRLKPQDIVILLKLLAIKVAFKRNSKKRFSGTQSNLATHLCMSSSEVNAAIKRLSIAGLIGTTARKSLQFEEQDSYWVIKYAAKECLIHGVKYFFPGMLGEYIVGVPTAYAAPILKTHLQLGKEPLPVWPSLDAFEGGPSLEKGLALEPLYPSITRSLVEYPDLIFYELLTLIDTLRYRDGKVREKEIAAKLLEEKINDT